MIARCIAGSFLLRAAASGAAALIAFFLADLEHVHPGIRGSLIIGLASTLFFASEILGALGFGALVDRHGERRYVRLGPGFGAAAALVMALVASIPMVVLARVFQGLSTAAAVPATLAILSRESGDDERRRGRVMSFFEVAAIGGMAFGLVAIGPIWDAIGPAAFYLVVAAYVVSLAVLWPVGSTEPIAGHAREGAGMRFLRSPRAMRLVPAWVSVNAVLGVWLTHIAHQMKREDDPTQLLVGGFTGSQIGVFGGITLLLFVAGIAAWGIAMARLGSTRVMTLALGGLVLMAPALYFLNHSEHRGWVVVTLWLAASAVSLVIASGFTPAALTYLSKVAEEHAEERGAIMGVYSVLLGVGQAIGSAAGGLVADRWAVDGLIGVSVIFTFAAILAVAALARHEGRAEISGTPRSPAGALRPLHPR